MNTPNIQNNQGNPFTPGIDLLFTGAPHNQETISTDGRPDNYLSQFFNNPKSDHDVDYVVEVLPSKQTVYYTYLLRHQVKGYDRDGSYFGMSLRLTDAFCIDIQGIYHLLDKIFNERIRGTILTTNGDHSWKYLQQSLINADPMRRELDGNLGKELTEGLWRNSMKRFNTIRFESKASPSPAPFPINLYTNEQLLQQLQTSFRISLFPLKEEYRNKDAILRQKTTEYKKKLKESEEKLIAEKKRRANTDGLIAQLEQKESEITNLKATIDKKDQILKDYCYEGISKALEEINTKLANNGKSTQNERQWGGSTPKPPLNWEQKLIIAGTALLMILLAIDGLNLLKKPKPATEQPKTETPDQRQSAADSLQQKNTVDSTKIKDPGLPRRHPLSSLTKRKSNPLDTNTYPTHAPVKPIINYCRWLVAPPRRDQPVATDPRIMPLQVHL